MSADEQAIRELQATWFEATKNGDLPRVLGLMTDDVVFLSAGRPPFGKAEFASSFSAGQSKVRIEGKAEFEEVIISGDVAYARGKIAFEVTPLAGGTPRQMAGYTLTVFRKQPNGQWLLSRDANLVSPVT